MHLSVAICTWNRADLLRQTLAGLANATVPSAASWDVLVVNNACTDATDDVLAAFVGRLPLRSVHEPRPGLAHARNAVLDTAIGDYVLWTDDDVMVHGGWLVAFEACAARHPDAVAFGGPVTPWFPRDPDPVMADVFPALRHGFCGIDHGAAERALDGDEPVFGANFAVSRSAVGSLRFDPTLGHSPSSLIGGEETEFLLTLRRRGSVIWCPDLRVQHYVAPDRMTLGYLERFMVGRGRRMARDQMAAAARMPDGRMRDAVDDRSGPRLAAPRWILRALVENTLASRWHRARGRRRESLERARDAWIFRGMLLEYRSRPRPAHRAPRTGQPIIEVRRGA